MSFPTGQNKREDPVFSSDVKAYGYHSYKTNRRKRPSVSGPVKGLMFISLFSLWQIGIFSFNPHDLPGGIPEQQYITGNFSQTSEIPMSDVTVLKDDGSNAIGMRSPEHDIVSETGSPPILSQPGEAITVDEMDLDRRDEEGSSIIEAQIDVEQDTTVTTGSGDFDGATVDRSRSISLDTEANEESDELDAATISRSHATTITTLSERSPTSTADDISSTSSTAISNRTAVETSISSTNQTVQTSSNGIVSFTANSFVANNGTEGGPEEQQYALWKAAKEEATAIQVWKNASTFLTVDRDDYQQVVKRAHASVASLVEDVYTDCEMYILPAFESGGGDKEINEKLKVQFKCLGDDNPVLKDELCHTVNVCRVVLNEEVWKEEASFPPSNLTSTNTSIDSSSNSNIKKSVLLMMVDSIEYLMSHFIFKTTLNKASYAYRSSRELFIWIGDLDQSELNRRETDSLESTFHFKCATKTLENSMHYYKPIAILALFNMLHGESIFFIDADADFTPLAFDRIANDKLQGGQSEKEDHLEPIGPESYLDISSQASLVGTQNVKGKMLMNSGLLIIRNTKWSRDFAATWWYARCGHKDQLGLWLVLYATFSAWTTPARNRVPVAAEDEEDRPFQFAYSGKMFFDYEFASTKLFMHFRTYGHRLQAAWKAVVEQQQTESSGVEMSNNDNYDYPVPTNIKLYNGGNPEGILPTLRGVMELPHVVILPQASIYFNKTIEEAADQEGISTVVQVELLRLKTEEGIDSFTSHSKALKSCSDRRCWPYVID